MKQELAQAAHDVSALAQRLVRSHPKSAIALIAALLVGGAGGAFAVAAIGTDESPVRVRQIVEDVRPAIDDAVISKFEAQAFKLYRSGVTRPNDTAEIFLKRLGVVDPAAAAFLRSDFKVQQLVLGRTGRNVTLEAAPDNTLLALKVRWSPEDDGMFKRLTVNKGADGFTSTVETLPMTVSSRLASATITSSLFAATDEARIPDSIAIQMAEIFSGDIDFHRSLRKGDRFTVVYETLEGDGEPLRAGRVLSAEFVNAGKSYQALWFQEPLANGVVTEASHGLSRGGYYTLAGESLHRAYLTSPLEFSRITSGFQMRFHPILQIWKAHLGVDYAAAMGTPVRSVGDGVVEFAGVQNGFGNVVIIQHRQGHETVYAHLSKIGVQRGQSVVQGQNVGLSGATGWATGPHLHFEFRVNGVHQDPQMIARQSEAVPVAAAFRPLFNKAAAQVRAELAAASQMQASNVE